MPFRLPAAGLETPLLRTDSARPDRWQALLAQINIPDRDGFLAYVTICVDPGLEGLSESEIPRLPREDNAASFVLVADQVAQADDEFPILVVDISGADRPSFRVTARCLWSVQNNLSLANMDWEEFADNTDDLGVYRTC